VGSGVRESDPERRVKKDFAANAWVEDFMPSAETKRHVEAEYEIMQTILTDLGVATSR
jgi:tripartite-type tricarboxylate transporter receptor subunit TctC